MAIAFPKPDGGETLAGKLHRTEDNTKSNTRPSWHSFHEIFSRIVSYSSLLATTSPLGLLEMQGGMPVRSDSR